MQRFGEKVALATGDSAAASVGGLPWSCFAVFKSDLIKEEQERLDWRSQRRFACA